MKTYISKLAIYVISAFRNTNGTLESRYDWARTVAGNLYLYGDEKNGIMAFDLPAYEQALKMLEEDYNSKAVKY